MSIICLALPASLEQCGGGLRWTLKHATDLGETTLLSPLSSSEYSLQSSLQSKYPEGMPGAGLLALQGTQHTGQTPGL